MKTYQEANTGAVLRARTLRREAPKPERMLLRALRETFPDQKWRRQMPVGPYFADIACFAARLIIEADGGQHSEAASYDEARTRFLKSQGYRVLRFWNNDILENLDGVIITISLSLGRGRGPLGAADWEGEVSSSLDHPPSPSQPSAGPLPLPMGEEF